MNRSIIYLLALAVLALVAPAPARADDPAPTPAQMEKAKKAFQEGKKLHEQKKLPEAIEKFKESYNLSKNPLLLYNIGLTMDEATMEDLALFYYRKFLAEAPQDAAQRAEVDARVKVLEKKFNPGASETKPEGNGAGETKPVPTKPEPKKPVVIKPAGTYSASDFQHEVVETAPPAKPLDVTAFVPEDSGFVVTLYFRTAGEGKFVSKEMKWRYKELVGRIPAPKMIGTSVQYYIEVKDSTGAVIAKSGKSTSPNLVNLEPGAPQRFYPDFTEEGEAKVSVEDVKARDDEDDPLNKNKKPKKQTAVADDSNAGQPVDTGPPGQGFTDVGSKKFKYTKWTTTGIAGAAIGLGIYTFILAKNYGTQLEDDSTECGSPPCKPFDSTAADWQSAGKRYQTIANVSIGVGIVAGAVAGYFWYKDLTSKKHGERRQAGKGKGSPETSWAVVPTIGGDGTNTFGGATALTQF